jgi:flavin reductase (DIM6/NTAB) family NADH-FMN oxidoreductase RutF
VTVSDSVTMSDAAFSTIMASVDARLIVVTAAVDGERAGCLVGFHTQSSIDPERYCVWLSKANHTYRVAVRSTHLGVHFLTVDDRQLAERFGTLTGDTTDKFAGLPVTRGPHAVPVLGECPNRLVVRRIALLDEGGDHVCLITEPVTAHSGGPFTALRLSDVQHLVPGHDNDERSGPPTERAVSDKHLGGER